MIIACGYFVYLQVLLDGGDDSAFGEMEWIRMHGIRGCPWVDGWVNRGLLCCEDEWMYEWMARM